MRLSTCAALALTLGLSGGAAASEQAVQPQGLYGPAAVYWQCVYQSQEGMMYEIINLGRCPLTRNDPDLGPLILVDAYPI